MNAIGFITPAVIALASIAVYMRWSRQITRVQRGIDEINAMAAQLGPVRKDGGR